VKKLVALGIFLVVLVGLLVVADRVTKGIAEDKLADEVRSEISGSPEVRIDGFPFLTQALGGTYHEIHVSGGDIQQSGVPVSAFSADLKDVEVSLSDALSGKVDRVPVGSVDATAVVTTDALRDASGQDVQVAVVGSQLQITGAVSVAGRQVTAVGLADVQLQDDRVVVRPTGYSVDGQPAPAAVVQAVGNRLTLSAPVPQLPYGLVVTALAVSPRGVVVTAEAENTTLTR
jgi:hypothetical protein